jgi:UDP-glucose 4-epimerase
MEAAGGKSRGALLAGRRVLVTGATGFIGSRLTDRLIDVAAEVHASSRSERDANDRPVAWWRADLADVDTAVELVASIEPDIVFHLGGHVSGKLSPEIVLSTIRSNLLSTVGLLEAARRVDCSRIVVAGSVMEPELGEADSVPVSPYAASKWASSAYARMFHALWEVPVVVVRIGMVYGPGQSDQAKLVPHVVGSLLRGEAPKVTSGRHNYDWIYVDDVVEALLAAAVAPGIEGETVDIGSGERTSVREVVERLGRLVNAGVEPEFGALPDRPHPPSRVADVAKLKQLLGWQPRTTLNEGLERTVAWFQRRLPALLTLMVVGPEMA